MNEVEITVKLKSRKKSFTLIVDNIEQAKQFFALFENDNKYVRYGNLIFDKSEFEYAIYAFKKFSKSK